MCLFVSMDGTWYKKKLVGVVAIFNVLSLVISHLQEDTVLKPCLRFIGSFNWPSDNWPNSVSCLTKGDLLTITNLDLFFMFDYHVCKVTQKTEVCVLF